MDLKREIIKEILYQNVINEHLPLAVDLMLPGVTIMERRKVISELVKLQLVRYDEENRLVCCLEPAKQPNEPKSEKPQEKTPFEIALKRKLNPLLRYAAGKIGHQKLQEYLDEYYFTKQPENVEYFKKWLTKRLDI